MLMRARGFSLIELLIAVSLFALLIALAGPSYTEFIANHNIRNASEAMLNGLRLAQSQALKNNLRGLFTFNGTGWSVTVDDPDNPGTPLFKQDYAIDEGARQATVTATPGDATTVTFDGLGRLIANDDGTATLQTLDVTNSGYAGSRPLRVVVTNGASGIKLCDPAVASSEPQGCP